MKNFEMSFFTIMYFCALVSTLMFAPAQFVLLFAAAITFIFAVGGCIWYQL